MKKKEIDIFGGATEKNEPVTQDDVLDKLSSYLQQNENDKELLEDFEYLIGECFRDHASRTKKTKKL